MMRAFIIWVGIFLPMLSLADQGDRRGGDLRLDEPVMVDLKAFPNFSTPERMARLTLMDDSLLSDASPQYASTYREYVVVRGDWSPIRATGLGLIAFGGTGIVISSVCLIVSLFTSVSALDKLDQYKSATLQSEMDKYYSAYRYEGNKTANLRIAGWTLLSLGIAAVITGAVLMTLSRSVRYVKTRQMLARLKQMISLQPMAKGQNNQQGYELAIQF